MASFVRDLLSDLDERAPFAFAAEWDPVGLQVGRATAELGSVAVVHELTDSTTRACIDANIDTVVTYHPLVFRPLASVTDRAGAEGRVLELAGAGISVVAVHTNWDVAPGGCADALAAALGLSDVEAFGQPGGESETPPIGRIGGFTGDGTALRAVVEDALGGIIRSTPLDAPGRVAVLPGSGGGFVAASAAAGADVLVSGDISHHEARAAESVGMGVIDAGHGPTERPGMRALYAAVVEIVGAAVDLTAADDTPWEGG